MTNQSRSQSQLAQPQFLQPMMMLFAMPIVFPGAMFSPAAFPQGVAFSTGAPNQASPAQTATTTPAPAPAPAASTAPVPAPAASTAPAPAPATRTPPGAGLPAPLLALLRDADGPFLANEVFSAVPSQALGPIEEDVPAPEWYAITRGRFVGVVDQFALSAVAISGVAHGARKSYTTQALALDAFNKALTWGGVQVA
ncbi:hypothetical protein DFH06DRAFT_1332169 [Mycena polygramma]|nr:hypothetical protein DFH06DRAFT_1332169 [Mycena polygramma]